MPVTTPEHVHTFWFGELDPTGLASSETRAQWFASSPAFDQTIQQEFLATAEAAGQGQLEHWCTTPRGWVSYLIVCDQFTRNLWRDQAKAFSLDSRARQAARAGINAGLHRSLGVDEQSFCYMPFMHSEDLSDQYFAIGLFTTLRDHAHDRARGHAGNSLRHAQQHRDTILQFGRFPYRNQALGRAPTAAERAER